MGWGGVRKAYARNEPDGVRKFVDTGSNATRRSAFARVSQFWDEELEYFERTTIESQVIIAENHRVENEELFSIVDVEKTFSSFFSSLKIKK